MEFNYEM